MDQLSLVIFTVLGQASAGMALVQCLLLFLDDKQKPATNAMTYPVMLVLLGIAGIASLTHLGQPFRAVNVLGGLAHGSALSWEIIAVVAFGAAVALITGLVMLRNPMANNPLLLLFTAITGMIMVYAMSRVYNLHTVDAWFSIWTPLQFMATSLLLGFGIVAALDSINGNIQLWTKSGVVIAVLLTFMTIPVFALFLGSLPNMTTVLMDNNLALVRCTFLVAGAILLIVPMIRNYTWVRGSIFGVVCLVISELTGRAMFYDLLTSRIL